MPAKKRVLILSSIVLATVSILSGCGTAAKEAAQPQNGEKKEASQQAKSYTLKIGTTVATDHPQNVALREKFKPLVEDKSGGTLKVEIYENNKLGNEKEMYDGIRNGTLEMAVLGQIMEGDIEKMTVSDLPFLLKDLNHAKKVYSGTVGKEIADDMEKKHGVHVLAWTVNGIRAVSSNKTIKSIEDFKGMRLRMPNIPTYIALGRDLGANVTPLPLSEVFSALEQKVVDGQDNPIATLKANGWYEVQKEVLETSHVISPYEHLISGKFWSKLTAEQQKVLEEAAVQAADYQWDLYAKSLETDKKFLLEKGIKFTTPDDKFKQDLRAAVQPIYDEFYKKYPWGKEMVDRIQKEG